ncbi:MAG TPA: hypothetical protein VI193_04895, partial [Acidimicrobiia bacterium]
GDTTTTIDSSSTTTGGGDTTTTIDSSSTTTGGGDTTTTINGLVTTTLDDDQVGGITVTTSSVPSDGSSTLPFTGINRGQLIALGASALALGLWLVMAIGARSEEN